MSKSITIFVLEGESREVQLVGKLSDIFFKGKKYIEIRCLPSNGNIYMLWNLLNADDFETDIVELIRENIPQADDALKDISRQDIDEVYLFFDYDVQQRNLPRGVDAQAVIQQMLATFDNETENGKLYLSYPMVEAVRDFEFGSCRSATNCVVNQEDFKTYKQATGASSCDLTDFAIWKDILKNFVMRTNCLFDKQNINFVDYKQWVTPLSIYERQLQKYIRQNKIFVLSAFPEFLFDYFRIDFWKANAKKQRPIKNCKRK